MMNFCPGCGKEVEGTYCEDCRPLKKLAVKPIDIKVCVECGRYFYKNKWRKKSLEKGVEEVARHNIRQEVQSVHPNIPQIKPQPGLDVDIEIAAETKEGTAVIPGQIHYTYCNICSKKGTDYFEGVLQLRNPSENILNQIEHFMEDNAVFITKQVPVNDGVDLFFTDSRKMQALAKNLQNSYGGELKTSSTLFTKDRQTSKEVHRVSVLYRAPNYAAGDVIVVEDMVVLITSLGKKGHGINLKTGNKVIFDSRDTHDILEKHKTRVSKIQPRIEVLDPQTYQSVPVENKAEVQLDEKVKVATYKGKVYLTDNIL